MRFRKLGLRRYGKFTDAVIDFGERPVGAPDLHIVYGPNEAGKSTALSACMDLFYGIHHQSRFNFLHPYPTMRIEADLETTTPDGSDKPKIDPRYARFRMIVRPSRIHRWGVFAAQIIPARAHVIEYTGERISRREAKRRSARELHYLFDIDNYWKLDGAVGGSGAEYINHSCEPNLWAEIDRSRVHYISKRRIQPGEELLIDYMFSKSDERVECHCGARNCRGTINKK